MLKKPAKVTPDMNRAQLPEDLQKYREKALELGAGEAKIIKTEEIPVEEAVVVKCRMPRCFGYGASAHCPPRAPKPAEMKEYLKEYEWAIFFVKNVPPELLLRDRSDKERRDAFRSIYDIVSEIESMAFYDGHYLAFGLGAGSCRRTFCDPHESCRALEGDSCRFPVSARPSMEAVGINVYKMVASAGWEIFPIGKNVSADHVPKAILAGIIVIQ
jgi:predicted metal-binding protein